MQWSFLDHHRRGTRAKHQAPSTHSFCLFVGLSTDGPFHAQAHDARRHACTHGRAHARTHARTHTGSGTCVPALTQTRARMCTRRPAQQVNVPPMRTCADVYMCLRTRAHMLPTSVRSTPVQHPFNTRSTSVQHPFNTSKTQCFSQMHKILRFSKCFL